MPPRTDKCVGNCRRDIAVGQTVFQVYEGGYWATPYITPGRHKFLGNWCVDCFQRDLGHLILRQVQAYECVICNRGFEENEPVMYVTLGLRPAEAFIRAEKRGNELHVIACQNCWKDPRFEKLYKIYRLLS